MRSSSLTIRTNLLLTQLGPLDVMRAIGSSGFEDLLDSVRTLQLGKLRLRVLTLSKVIESKELANRDKDKAVLPVLRKTLELRRERL